MAVDTRSIRTAQRVDALFGEPVGIMADSHGMASAIAAALAVFDAHGCRQVVHLGDICDSEAPGTVNAAIWPLLTSTATVLAVMGNNEYALLQRSTARSAIDDKVWTFMAALPMQIEAKGHVFIHNRPFPDLLGVSCLLGDITLDDVRRFDRQFHGVVLFRGHSHQPSVCHTGREPVPVGSPVKDPMVLSADDNWIVTCGALQSGWCMVWHPDKRELTVHRL